MKATYFEYKTHPSPAAKSEEKRMFSQAKKVLIYVFLFCVLFSLFVCFFFLQFLLIFYTLIIRRIHLNQISINLVFVGFKQVG